MTAFCFACVPAGGGVAGLIGMGIAAVVEKLRKVHSGCADESSGKRGSFHKVIRAALRRYRSDTRSRNSLDQFNRNKENFHGIGCPE
jgi:hypothetical protein